MSTNNIHAFPARPIAGVSQDAERSPSAIDNAGTVEALQPIPITVPAESIDDLTGLLAQARCDFLHGRFVMGQWDIELMFTIGVIRHTAAARSKNLSDALGTALEKALKLQSIAQQENR